ncbi:MAG: DMT family transporter [Actinobacteria bacterium]|nr:MAG: DMT family transporter [Actinomycetota bacterium]
MRARNSLERYRWELALIGVAVIWGATFTVVKDAVARMPPFLFIGLRFLLAAGVLAIIGAFRGLTKREMQLGAITGFALFAGYAFQTVGLQYTTASNAGFITGMFVVFTPVIGAIVFRRLPSTAAGLGVILATGGLVLLAMPSGFHLRRGDALEVMTAITFAVHILLIARLGKDIPALRFTAVQIATAALLALAWSAVGEHNLGHPDAGTWFGIVLTGILATALAFLVQTRAQKEIPPTRTAVILTAEPVFAGIFGYLVADDRLGARGYAGAGLIVAGILVAELFAPSEEVV